MMPTWLLSIVAVVWFGLCSYAAYRWGRLLWRRYRFWKVAQGLVGIEEQEVMKLRRKSASLFFGSTIGLIIWAVVALATRGSESLWIELSSILVLLCTPFVLARAGHLEDQHDERLARSGLSLPPYRNDG